MSISAENVEAVADRMMAGLDLEQSLSQVQNFAWFQDRLAPQELDKLSALLAMGLRLGLQQVIAQNVSDGDKQLKLIETAINVELKKASEDFSIQDLEKKFNTKDFSARVYAALPRV